MTRAPSRPRSLSRLGGGAGHWVPEASRPITHTPALLLQTDYFHLFICVAIVVIYGDDVIEQQLATDQMLLHFGNLAMHMNGELVLRKVSAVGWRGLTCRGSECGRPSGNAPISLFLLFPVAHTGDE